jgi:hypothetical protein
MMFRCIAITLCLAVAGCGGPSVYPLNQAFGGEWSGSFSFDGGNLGSRSPAGNVNIIIDGNTATIGHVCLDGTGSLGFTGTNDVATFTGNYVCEAVQFNGCDSVESSFVNGSATITTGSYEALLQVGLQGNVSGCGQEDSLVVLFIAVSPR